jgi:AraC-like DNA-binding protein
LTNVVVTLSIDQPDAQGLGKIAVSAQRSNAMTHSVGVTVSRETLAQGRGWSAHDVTFRATSRRARFEGRHDFVSVCAVTAGSFRYRGTHGSVTLMPGALLLGNADEEFACAYDEAGGDRCVSFYYAPEYLERIAAATADGTHAAFRQHRASASAAVTALTARIEAQRTRPDTGQWEELALCAAGDALAAVNDVARRSSRDERRIASALGFIEANASEPLSVAAIADAVQMSPYHFLRVFRAVAGVTPHQYLVRTRLRRAAVALATTDEPVAAIAFEHGFGDLSSFVTTFGRVFGSTPSVYRRKAHAVPLRHHSA